LGIRRSSVPWTRSFGFAILWLSTTVIVDCQGVRGEHRAIAWTDPWSSECDVTVAALHQESQTAPGQERPFQSAYGRESGAACDKRARLSSFASLRKQSARRRARQEFASPRETGALLTEPPARKSLRHRTKGNKSNLTQRCLPTEGSSVLAFCCAWLRRSNRRTCCRRSRLNRWLVSLPISLAP
jgi:hypothetical protein